MTRKGVPGFCLKIPADLAKPANTSQSRSLKDTQEDLANALAEIGYQ